MKQHDFTGYCIRWLVTSLLGFVLLSPAVMADVLTIPNLDDQSAIPAENVVHPKRGMTMEEVSAQFGNPKEIKPPVGNPPITRWVYDKFTVHFEQNYVIHSVIHRK
jgi:hypothetical protein